MGPASVTRGHAAERAKGPFNHFRRKSVHVARECLRTKLRFVAARGPFLKRARGCVDGDFIAFHAAAEAANKGTRTTSSNREKRTCSLMILCLQTVCRSRHFLFCANLSPVIKSAVAVLEILGQENQDKRLRRFGKLSSRPENRAYRHFPDGSGIRADLSP